MSEVVKQADHVSDGLALLASVFGGATKLRGMLTAFLEEIQALEDSADQLRTQRAVDTAVGVQLDLLGAIVGQAREGRSDTDYRAWIKARIRINRSNGTAKDIYEVLELVLGTNAMPLVRVHPQYPAAVIVENDGVSTPPAALLAQLVGKTASAGVLAQYVYVTHATNNFTFASTLDNPENTATLGFADSMMSGGGQLAGVING